MDVSTSWHLALSLRPKFAPMYRADRRSPIAPHTAPPKQLTPTACQRYRQYTSSHVHNLRRCWMRFGMIVFLLTLSVYIFLVPDRTSAKLTSPAPRQLKVGKATPEVQQLRDAYHILEVANHDYKGHRKAAM